jgi:hypothetical protein
MRNFLRLATGIDVSQLVLSLYRYPELWNQHDFRSATPGSPHYAVEDILLRCQCLDGSIHDPRESINYPAFTALPEAYRLVMAAMACVQGERLGRCMITRLKPGDSIAPHSDVGNHPLHYEQIRYWGRYHLVLQDDPCALFRCGDEIVHMATGELWYFRNDIDHEVFWHGAGQVDRIHLIIDIHTANEPVGGEKQSIHPHMIEALADATGILTDATWGGALPSVDVSGWLKEAQALEGAA